MGGGRLLWTEAVINNPQTKHGSSLRFSNHTPPSFLQVIVGMSFCAAQWNAQGVFYCLSTSTLEEFWGSYSANPVHTHTQTQLVCTLWFNYQCFSCLIVYAKGFRQHCKNKCQYLAHFVHHICTCPNLFYIIQFFASATYEKKQRNTIIDKSIMQSQSAQYAASSLQEHTHLLFLFYEFQAWVMIWNLPLKQFQQFDYCKSANILTLLTKEIQSLTSASWPEYVIGVSCPYFF